MKFNAKKCYIISTEKGGIPFFYTLNDHILQYVGTNPYLGVTLSEDLTFDAHVGNITKKGSRMLGFIQRNLKGIPDIGSIWPGICICCLGPVPAEGNRSPRKDPAQGGTLCHQ